MTEPLRNRAGFPVVQKVSSVLAVVGSRWRPRETYPGVQGAEWKVCSLLVFRLPSEKLLFVEAVSVLPFITVTAIAPGPEGHCATLHQRLLSLGEYSIGIEDNQKQRGFKTLLNVPVTMRSGSPRTILFNSHTSPNRLILI